MKLGAQDLSSFNSLTVTYKFHPKYFLFLETQMRGIESFSYPDYYEVKGGVGYNLTPNHKPFIGIGRYGTYKDHKFDKEEFRIWLQDVVDVKAGKFKLENRVRAEKGWFYSHSNGEKTDRIRFRYRLNVSLPLNNDKVEPGTIFVNAYDELFFTISDNDPWFSRNRLYGGIGYQVDPTFGLATGYLWQREFGLTSNTNLNFIYLALNINLKSKNDDDDKVFSFPGAD